MSTTTVLARTARAEWSRIWTVRSSWIFVLVTATAVVGIGTLIGYDVANGVEGVPEDATAWDGGQSTAMFALFGVLALSVVTATADHSTGGIVPTMQWTPRRSLLLVARTAVIAVTTTLIGVLLVAAASTMIWSFVPEAGLPVGDGAEVLGGLALVFGAGALLAVGIGLALRSTAGGMVSVVGLVLVLPMLFAQLPYDWATEVSAAMPGSNALFLIFGEGPSDDMTVTSSRVILGLWAAGALAAGSWRLLRADANR